MPLNGPQTTSSTGGSLAEPNRKALRMPRLMLALSVCQPSISRALATSINNLPTCPSSSTSSFAAIMLEACTSPSIQTAHRMCPRLCQTLLSNFCAAYVGAYAQNLTEAFWEINRIQVYQMPSGAATTSSYSTSLSTVSPTSQSSNTLQLGMGATVTMLSSAPPYTGPISSATSSSPASVATGAMCPQYNETTVSDAAGYQYSLKYNQEYNAASAHIGQATSYDACLVKCDGWAGCRGVTITPSSQSNVNGPGTCYSKVTPDT